MIAQDFVFLGILTANELSKFRDHGPGPGAAGTIRTERARRPVGDSARTSHVAAWVSGFLRNDEDGAARGDFLAAFRKERREKSAQVAPPPHALDLR